MRSALALLAVFCALSSPGLAADTRPPFIWNRVLSAGPQTVEIINQGRLPDGRMLDHLVFGELAGEWPKAQAVLLVRDNCHLGALVIGKYGQLTSGEGEALYHLDLYLPDSHHLIDVLESPPSQEYVWEKGLEYLAHPPE